ncbi:uncharacterized protein ACOB8E_007672 [Sarcophilus harrisii]
MQVHTRALTPKRARTSRPSSPRAICSSSILLQDYFGARTGRASDRDRNVRHSRGSRPIPGRRSGRRTGRFSLSRGPARGRKKTRRLPAGPSDRRHALARLWVLPAPRQEDRGASPAWYAKAAVSLKGSSLGLIIESAARPQGAVTSGLSGRAGRVRAGGDIAHTALASGPPGGGCKSNLSFLGAAPRHPGYQPREKRAWEERGTPKQPRILPRSHLLGDQGEPATPEPETQATAALCLRAAGARARARALLRFFPSPPSFARTTERAEPLRKTSNQNSPAEDSLLKVIPLESNREERELRVGWGGERRRPAVPCPAPPCPAQPSPAQPSPA